MTTLSDILFPGSMLQIINIDLHPDNLVIEIQSSSCTAHCPHCQQHSSRHHSSYQRRVQDTPMVSLTVWVQIKVRRFRCDNSNCSRKTFAEQFDAVVSRRKRRTHRLLSCFSQIELALGGSAGARLGKALGMVASGRHILQLVRQLPCPIITSASVIGIDDWAFRKGRTYGTIIKAASH